MSNDARPWAEALPDLYKRVARDAEFRALCLKDAGAAILQLGDYKLPDEFTVRFVEKLDVLCVPLPPFGDGHLDLDELEAVAGGAGGPLSAPQVYQSYPQYGYNYQTPSVWPPVDPNTATGLPPLIKPGGAPPGY